MLVIDNGAAERADRDVGIRRGKLDVCADKLHHHVQAEPRRAVCLRVCEMTHATLTRSNCHALRPAARVTSLNRRLTKGVAPRHWTRKTSRSCGIAPERRTYRSTPVFVPAKRFDYPR